MRKLIVISAPSGAGKTTLCAKLLKEIPSLMLSISSTTRAPRGAERHGHEYYFVSKEEFERQIQAGGFAEWAKVHDNYYGTAKRTIEDAFKAGKAVLLDIDVQGAASLKKAYPAECVTIFVRPPSMEALEARLRARGTDGEETIQKRLRNARAEMACEKEFDHVVVNDDLDRAYGELKTLVLGALGRALGKAVK